MENLGKKVGFLKGLMEGMDFKADSANGKLLAGIVDLLGDLSDRVEAADELLAGLTEQAAEDAENAAEDAAEEAAEAEAETEG